MRSGDLSTRQDCTRQLAPLITTLQLNNKRPWGPDNTGVKTTVGLGGCSGKLSVVCICPGLQIDSVLQQRGAPVEGEDLGGGEGGAALEEDAGGGRALLLPRERVAEGARVYHLEVAHPAPRRCLSLQGWLAPAALRAVKTLSVTCSKKPHSSVS